MKKLSIMLVDDHRMFRDALRTLLEKEAHIEVVAEASNGLEVTRLARAASPDIVCMDINLPGMNGIETTRRLVAALPHIKVIAVSVIAEQRYILDMFDAGAVAYVNKVEAIDELLRAIAAVRNNHKYLCPRAADVVANALSGQHAAQVSPPTQLGPRERHVLQLVAEGASSSQIADRLNIAQSTVDVHRRNIMRKLDLHSVAELTRYAINNGLAPN